MGWTGIHYGDYIASKKDKKAALDAEFGDDVVASAIVNNVYYSAMRRYDGKIFAMVTLIQVDNSEYFNLHYKDMDESMCPCYYDCPKYIMNMLSDTEYDSAKEWRKRVEENRKKPKITLKEGDIVRFAKPIEFTDGCIASIFNVVKYNGRFAFEINGRLYKIRKYKEKKFEIIY